MEASLAAHDRMMEIEALYRADGERLWSAVYAYAGDGDVASDAVAEAFAQLLHRGVEVRDPRRWVWRVAFTIARGYLADRRETIWLEHDPRSYEMSESADDLMTALRQLSPHQRASVVLYHGAGYSAREIALIVGSTRAAVKVHLMRGRRRLHELLQEDRP
jgi:RNA polymerase sigma factor (sigma-70 family)